MILPPPTVALTIAPAVVDGFVVVSTVATVTLPELPETVERMVPILFGELGVGVDPRAMEPETVTIEAVDATVDMTVTTTVTRGVGLGLMAAGVLEVVDDLGDKVLAIPEVVVPGVLVPGDVEVGVGTPELVVVGLLLEEFGVVLLVAGVLLDGLLVNGILVAWLLVPRAVPRIFDVGVFGPGVVLPEMVIGLLVLGVVVVFRVFVGVEIKVGVCTTEGLEVIRTEGANVRAAETIGVTLADMAVAEVVGVDTILIEVIEAVGNVVPAALPAVGVGSSPRERLTHRRSEHT